MSVMDERRAISNERSRVRRKLIQYRDRQMKGLNIHTGDRDADVVAFTAVEERFLEIYQTMLNFRRIGNKKEYCAAGFHLQSCIVDLQSIAHTPGPLIERVKQLNRTMRDLHEGVVKLNDEIHNRNQPG